MPEKAKRIRLQTFSSVEKARSDPVKSEKIAQQSRDSKTRCRSDADKCKRMRMQHCEAMKKINNDPVKKVKRQKQTRKAVQKFRSLKIVDANNHDSSFPPVVSEVLKKKCIEEYKKATSLESLSYSTCGICGVESIKTEGRTMKTLPNKHLLKEPQSGTVFKEYKHNGLLLVKEGIHNGTVNCCIECLRMMKSNKLPACSVANGLQFGSVPTELMDLTIPEKLSIQCYRPSVYIIKLKEIAGPGTAQRAIKGNTITFPTDVDTLTNKIQSLPQDVNSLMR